MSIDIVRDTEMLAEFAELALVLARDLQAKALATETVSESAEAAQAFHAVGRSLRQSLALKTRLVRDAARADREARDDADLQTVRRRDRHRARIEKPLERLIWTETEDEDEAERLVDLLDDRLAEAVLSDTFLADPVDVHIARLSADLGLEPSPPAAGTLTETPWRSSA